MTARELSRALAAIEIAIFNGETGEEECRCSLAEFIEANPGVLTEADESALLRGGEVAFGGGAQPFGFLRRAS